MGVGMGGSTSSGWGGLGQYRPESTGMHAVGVCVWVDACMLANASMHSWSAAARGSEGVPVGKHMRRRKLGCESCCIVVVCECGNRRVTYEQAVLPNEQLDILLVRLFV